MPFPISCPHCRAQLLIADHLAGRTICCPKCRQHCTVPGEPAAPQEEAPGAQEPQSPAAGQQQRAPAEELELAPPPQDPAEPTYDFPIDRCPNCGQSTSPGRLVCGHCGLDFQTGIIRPGQSGAARWRRQLAVVGRTALAAAVFVGCAWGLWHAYKQGLFKSIAEVVSGPKDTGEQQPPEAQPPPPPKTTTPTPPKTTPPVPTKTVTPAPPKTVTPAPTKTVTPAPTKTVSPAPTKTTPPQPGPATPPKPQPPVKTTPVAPPARSLLVVTNQRYLEVAVFVDRARRGQAPLNQSLRLPLPAPPKDKPTQISFEVRLSQGLQLDENVKKALDTPLLFDGTELQGRHVIFRGPDPKLLPQPDEALPQLIPGLDAAKEVATGVGLVKSLRYKDVLLKPPPPRTALVLGWKEQGQQTQLVWLPQDCIVERGGAVVYAPPALPYEVEVAPVGSR